MNSQYITMNYIYNIYSRLIVPIVGYLLNLPDNIFI